MKLNKLRPNTGRPGAKHHPDPQPSQNLHFRRRLFCAQLLAAVSILIGSASVGCFGASASQDALIAPTNQSSSPQVTNLRLEPDFRAVKLVWSYLAAERPASFDVRYCELTSWNIEIKCRHRELQVAPNSSTVIDGAEWARATSEPPSSYEAHIFDLRALTNYTFQVRPLEKSAGSGGSGNGRHLRLLGAPNELDGGGSNLPQARIETKPFSAEATKCLAEASEVVVQTGRHFGGRISVEDSADARCQLLGNRSSEQTSYLFRIDHQACASRLVDGNRIETMVLVHENKDILTHNTARFLVLCNFQQRAFTLRASVALPKVQSQHPQHHSARAQPALITPVRANQQQQQQVMLGSMPGVWRARAAIGDDMAASTTENHSAAAAAARELESNTIGNQAAGGKEVRRQSKELARSLLLTDDGGGGDKDEMQADGAGGPPQPPPRPVQVQSKVLYVERSDEANGALSARRSRQHHLYPKLLVAARRQLPPSSDLGAAAESLRRQREEAAAKPTTTPAAAATSTVKTTGADEDSAAAPIIMTNNHRVSMQMRADSRSIKLPDNGDSGHRRWPATAASSELAQGQQQQQRARSGRMRNMEAEAGVKPANRMGEVAPAKIKTTTATTLMTTSSGDNDLSAAETGGAAAELAPIHLQAANLTSAGGDRSATLAQNITSYLLKWSLKTLTSLARKSLESLIRPNETAADFGAAPAAWPADGGELAATTTEATGRRFEQAATTRSWLMAPTREPPGAKLAVMNDAPRSVVPPPTTPTRPSAGEAAATAATTTTTEEAEGADGFIVANEPATTASSPAASTTSATSSPAYRDSEGARQPRQRGWREPPQGPPQQQRDATTAVPQRSPTGAGTLALLVGTLVACTGFVVALCLTLAAPAHRRRRNLERLDAASSPPPPPLSFQADDNRAPTNHDSYQQEQTPKCRANGLYNKLDNCASPSPFQHHLETRQPEQDSSSLSSAATTTLAAQADCKNSELLFTDHVLLRTGAHFGESYA